MAIPFCHPDGTIYLPNNGPATYTSVDEWLDEDGSVIETCTGTEVQQFSGCNPVIAANLFNTDGIYNPEDFDCCTHPDYALPVLTHTKGEGCPE